MNDTVITILKEVKDTLDSAIKYYNEDNINRVYKETCNAEFALLILKDVLYDELDSEVK